MKGLLKKVQRNGSQEGKPLLLYLLPGLLVGMVTLLLLAVLAHQVLSRGADAQAGRAMAQAASMLTTAISEEVRNRTDRLRFLADQADLARRMATGMSDEDMPELQAQLLTWLPGAIELRILPADWGRLDREDQGLPAPLGFAGIEMLRRVVATGKVADAEVHRADTPKPYIALAVPLWQDRQVVGVLLAAYPPDSLSAQVQSLDPLPGALRLEQAVDRQRYVLTGIGSQRVTPSDKYHSYHVAGTIWQVSFATARQLVFGLELLPFLGFVLLGMLPLALIFWLVLRMLKRAIGHDLEIITVQADALAEGRDVGRLYPRLSMMGGLCKHLADLLLDAKRRRNEGAPAGAPAGQGASPAATVTIPREVFRAYDIRGVADEQLTPAFAQRLGQALAARLLAGGGQKVVVGRDVRHSSPRLLHNLVEGLTRGGCDVLDLGMAPTPLVYFAQHALPADGAVVVTGSHNPDGENGFKIVIGSEVLAGDELAALREQMLQAAEPAARQGNRQPHDVSSDYVARVVGDVTLARPLKVVVDAGNGAAGPLAVQLLEALGCEVLPLFCQPDGNFPHHHPDPSCPDNLAALTAEVQAREADIGLAFDGDGDRLGVVDSSGQHIWPDRVLMLLARDVLTRQPGGDILYDVKCSRHVGRFILANGGRPIMGQSGHARMRARMAQISALLGGEFSGHFFISERWYGFDDALYAAARLLEVLAHDTRPSAEQFAEIPDSPSTPEVHLSLAEGENVEMLERLAEKADFNDAELVTLDGLRVEFADGWGLVRPSNTTASLVFRFEADDEAALARIQARMRDWLERAAPGLQAPF